MLNFMFSLLLTLNCVGEDCTRFDLIIICDYSASIRGHEREVSNAVDGFSKSLYIGEEDTKFGVIVFSDYSQLWCPLTTDKALLDEKIQTLHTLDVMSTTVLQPALLAAYDEFKTHGRENTKKIIILISDGTPYDRFQALDVADMLKLMEVDVFTLLVNGETIDEGYMKAIASPNSYYNTNYQQLLNRLKNINFCL